jgi:nitrate/nitrite transport system substrate-binding protein
MQTDKREYSFAQTFPTGTHAMWLYYWLANYGINPMKDAKVVTVPPPQMVANMRVGNMDGFCVGEPWNHRAIVDGVGVTAATTQDIWKDHPEKTLGTTAEWAAKYPNTARALIAAVLEASKWIDAGLIEQEQDGRNHRRQILCQHLGRRDQPAHPGPLPEWHGQDLGRPEPHEVLQRRHGQLPLPVGRHVVHDPAQALGPAQERSGLPGRRQRVNQTKLYTEAASMAKVSVPKSPMRTTKLIDGTSGMARIPRPTPTASRSKLKQGRL